MSDLSPGIEKFLREFEATKGYGREWTLLLRYLRTRDGGFVGCCPLTAKIGADSCMWEAVAAETSDLDWPEATAIAAAADGREGPIRARLLKAVGLEEAE